MTWRAALAVGAAYVVAGKAGLSLAFLHASASPVWPPTGIALAACLLLGPRVGPVVFVAAFTVNVMGGGGILPSLAIAAGNTLEALLGFALIRRFAGGARFVDHAAGTFVFTLAALASAVVSATVGVTTLALAGSAAWPAYPAIWLTRWLGDVSGALIVTPLILLWGARRLPRPAPAWMIEAALLALTIAAVSLAVFGGGVLGLPARGYPLAFLTLPPLMWAAFRFGRRGVATTLFVFTAAAVWGTLRGLGPFAVGRPNDSLLVLQAFMATVAATMSIVAAVVAERRAAEDAERVAREQAEQASRGKDEFVAILSHELRTPLNAVLGWATMLRSGELDALTAARALETIERNARLQARLVEDLLDISRIILGQVRLVTDLVALPHVVGAAVESLRPEADAKNVKLEVRTEAALVVGDAARLEQVVSNLVSNAIKFTPAGQSVTVTLRRAGSGVRLEVADTGKGISAKFLPHLFERFRQADVTRRRAYGGLGIGLAIVRHLVELHGGTVHAESRGEGYGATFVVDLPAAPLPG